jgi:hypothetical protein
MHTLEDIEVLEKELNEHKADVERRLAQIQLEKANLLNEAAPQDV